MVRPLHRSIRGSRSGSWLRSTSMQANTAPPEVEGQRQPNRAGARDQDLGVKDPLPP